MMDPCPLRRVALLAELEIVKLAVIIVTALVGFSVSGLAGFGGGVMVLPVLVWAYGPREAVPVVAMAQLLGTFTRAWLNRREIDWPVVRWFGIGSVPLAVLGSFLFVSADTALITRIMGGGMIAIVVFTQLPWARRVRMTLWGFAPLGALAGFLSAFLGIPGPFPPVFYLAYGLTPAAYIASFSLGMFLVQAPKLVVLGGSGLFSGRVIGLGLTCGVISVFGSYFGHRLLRRVPQQAFAAGVSVMVLAFGVLFLVIG